MFYYFYHSYLSFSISAEMCRADFYKFGEVFFKHFSVDPDHTPCQEDYALLFHFTDKDNSGCMVDSLLFSLNFCLIC